MFEYNILSSLMLLFAGMSNGIMDSLQFHYKNSLLDKLDGDDDNWDPDKSWINKHKEYGNSFIANCLEYLRRTAFVFITDAWHLAQWFMITFICIAIITYRPEFDIFIDFIIMRFVPFQIGFYIMYDVILKPKK